MDYLNQQDLQFLLFDWLEADKLSKRSNFSDHDIDTMRSVLDLAAQMARETFAQNFKVSDEVEPQLVDGKVVLPEQTKQDLDAYRDAGFFAAGFEEQYGGMGLPFTVALAAQANFFAANCATTAYPMLTNGNARLIINFGNQKQIETWALPEVEGRYFGTMCLSEPAAGSSLGDIRTKAQHTGSDEYGERYLLRGNKMWISGGDHELSDNIVHLVLAKVADENGDITPGVKGISIFVVPKILPDGRHNDVAVAGLNHKMGYRGTSNCLLNFGEGNGAIGWRIGDLGQGLAIMFQMMNEARIGVGMGASCMAYRGYVQSSQYAKERPQGRSLTNRDPASPQIPIIEHVDVKRMLLQQKAYAEGAMALSLFSAYLADNSHSHPNKETRQADLELLELLTPVAKSWPSEFGLIANDIAIQVHGGYGYTREYDVEQLYRDNRLNPIHEGTFGIQAADLVGRKLSQNQGAGYKQLLMRISETTEIALTDPRLQGEIEHLTSAVNAMQQAVNALAAMGSNPAALDNAGAFLSAFGHVVVGWLWVSQTLNANDDSDFSKAKFAACRYFLRVELPKAITQFELVQRLESCVADVDSSLL
ncbi:acyl-CoA dehydrogenase [Paraferrimonas sp. SM1919]|uniref:acyl-CoA dehydrogenase n=1 Tax=Paraferrimonas sp. SM1919 TaxID=2662263 RepID=UPI0013D001F5|nr:acyl-CoA dehydrogenase [Paraferrimonas sp. SM1919]